VSGRRRVCRGVCRAVVLAGALAVLAGCPFSSDKPLSDPAKAAPDPALVGTWRAVDPESGEVNLVHILAFNDHEMIALTPGSDPGKTSAMRMFATKIGSEMFLNVQELGGSGWLFASYRVQDDTLRMKIVDDELFKDRQFASSEQLRAFVAASLGDPRLYAAADDTPTEMILTRVPPKS
jgi:hypothetical protein